MTQKPGLIDSIEAVVELARIQLDTTGEERASFDVVCDFMTNSWEDLEERFGDAARIEALREDGDFPDMDPDILPGIDTCLGKAMPEVLAMALATAREHPEIQVEDDVRDSLASINMTAAFWAAHGEGICDATVELDVSSFFPDP